MHNLSTMDWSGMLEIQHLVFSLNSQHMRVKLFST